MPNPVAQWKRNLLFIEFLVVLSVVLAVLLILSWLGGVSLASWVDTGRNALKMRKNLGHLSCDEILALAKKGTRRNAQNNASGRGNAPSDAGAETDRIVLPDNREIPRQDLLLYAFTINPRGRQGVWALLAVFFLCVLISVGPHWGLLILSTVALFLFGLCRLVQGLMEVV